MSCSDHTSEKHTHRDATTRRNFVTAAAGAALAAGGILACADAQEVVDELAGEAEGGEEDDAESEEVVEPVDARNRLNSEGVPYGQADSDGNISIISSFMDIMDEFDYKPDRSYTLPAGSVVYASSNKGAAVIQANTDRHTLTCLGYLDYETGEYSILLEGGITSGAYSVSEARITENLIAWVEVNNATEDWVLYACAFTDEPITTATVGLVKLGEAEADWLPAQFDCEGTRVVWQLMPDPSGPYYLENSHAYLWTLGASRAEEVWTSPGRFSCAPNFSDGILTIAPRVKPTEGVYYGITALDVDHGMTQLDQLIMPVSVKPFFVTYIGSNFAFSVEADYGYGGRLGTMGYYIGDSQGPYHYVYREPTCQICYLNGYYIVKSTLAYLVIDLDRLTYGRISAASGCTSYGEYAASAGVVSTFVTYSTIKDGTTGIPSHVLVRLFFLT